MEKVNDFRAKGTTIFMSCHDDWLVKAISNKVYTSIAICGINNPIVGFIC